MWRRQQLGEMVTVSATGWAERESEHGLGSVVDVGDGKREQISGGGLSDERW
jgi:hypothetical protein